MMAGIVSRKHGALLASSFACCVVVILREEKQCKLMRVRTFIRRHQSLHLMYMNDALGFVVASQP